MNIRPRVNTSRVGYRVVKLGTSRIPVLNALNTLGAKLCTQTHVRIFYDAHLAALFGRGRPRHKSVRVLMSVQMTGDVKLSNAYVYSDNVSTASRV